HLLLLSFPNDALPISYPLVIQYSLTISTWFIFFVIIEHMGVQALASSNIVKVLYISWAIPIFALGSTANSMVSNSIGQGRPEWRSEEHTSELQSLRHL